MKEYLKKRLTQPSTFIGLAAMVSSLVLSHGVVDANVVSQLLTALGLVHIDEQAQ